MHSGSSSLSDSSSDFAFWTRCEHTRYLSVSLGAIQFSNKVAVVCAKDKTDKETIREINRDKY